MTQAVAGQLEDLARTDPVVARLAVLQAIALRAGDDPAWQEGVPDLPGPPSPEVPLLHGQALRVDPDRARQLLGELVGAAVRAGVADAEPLARAARDAAADPLAILEAGLVQDPDRIAGLATGLGYDPALLQLFARLLATPLLRACRAKAGGLIGDADWTAGYCPVCAAWPVLAESRGLGKERWLRCGGCGGGWRYAHLRCVFCGNADHRTQRYLAAESERETRRAEVCERCRSYLKTISTFAELDAEALAAHDLTSLELDVAALQADFSRPAWLGFRMDLRIAPLPRPARRLWVPVRWPGR